MTGLLVIPAVAGAATGIIAFTVLWWAADVLWSAWQARPWR